MKVRVISPDGVVSSDTYEHNAECATDSKGRVMITDGNGNSIAVHKLRILPEDSFGKAVVIEKNNRQFGHCPKCNKAVELDDNGEFRCPECGVFDTIGDSIKPIRSKKTKPSRPPKEEKPVTQSEPKVKTKKSPAVLDIEIVKTHGELWTKFQQKFDHAQIDLQSHILLNEEPLRKLCFNTYNGSLGKKSKEPEKELKLTHFKDNSPDEQGKSVGYVLKGETIESMRQKLDKDGYKRQQ